MSMQDAIERNRKRIAARRLREERARSEGHRIEGSPTYRKATPEETAAGVGLVYMRDPHGKVLTLVAVQPEVHP